MTPEQKEKKKSYQKKYYEKNKESIIARTNKRKKDFPDLIHDEYLRRTYGIDREQYLRLLASQGGVCAICSKNEQKKALHVDHNHVTGAIRGLLCGRCNASFERLERVPYWTRRAEAYYQKYEAA